MTYRERGSVVGYALGAVLLAALLVGGIVLFKNNTGNLSGSAQNQSDNKVADTSKQEDTSSDADQAAKNEAALKQQQEAEQKAKEQAAAEAAAAAQAAKDAQAAAASQVPHTATVPESSALPKTGPTDNVIFTSIGFGALVGLGAAYVRSRAAI